jgi:hypothetical protein
MATDDDIRLPTEILTAVLEKVDVQDLWHVRMASRTLCAIVSPFVFRVLSVTSTVESARCLGRLLDVPGIAVHVREVSYEGIRDEWGLERGAFSFPRPTSLIITCLCICCGSHHCCQMAQIPPTSRFRTCFLGYISYLGSRQSNCCSSQGLLNLNSGEFLAVKVALVSRHRPSPLSPPASASVRHPN